MWFTLMSGISLMCSRTQLWRALQDCWLLIGLAKVLQRWYFTKLRRFKRFVFSVEEFERNPPRLLCAVHPLNKALTFFQLWSGFRKAGGKKKKDFYDARNLVIRPSLSEKEGFCLNLKKPLWSRLSPAAIDVNPVYTVFVNLSLLVKKWCLNSTQMWWFMGAWIQHRGTRLET